jgi:hypothetical protein
MRESAVKGIGQVKGYGVEFALVFFSEKGNGIPNS